MSMTRVLRRRFLADYVAAAYVLAYFGWLLVRTPGTPATTTIGTFAFYPLGLVVAWVNWRNARVSTLDRRTRLAWAMLSLSALSLWLSGTGWAFYIKYVDASNWPNWVEWTEFSQHVFAISGYLLFPGRVPPRESRARYVLDGCLILIASFILAFQFGLRESLREGVPTGNYELVQSAVDWLVFSIAALGYLQKRDATTRRVMGLMLAANASYFFANYALGSLPAYRSGDWVDALWFFAWVLRFSGARLAWHTYREPEGPAAGAAKLVGPEYSSARFAYLMVGGAFLLLMAQILWGDRQYLGLTAFAATLMAALLVGRQLAELRENGRLFRAQIAQEQRFRSLVQRSSDVVLVLGADGRLSYLSPSAETLFGDDPAARLGGPFAELLAPDDRRAVTESLEGCPGEARTFQARVRVRGSWRDMEAVASDLRDDPVVHGIVLNCRDVTDRNELEQQLRHAQKLDAVGHLAGGLAHDFNNVLTAIRGYTELLRLDLDDHLRASEDLQQIEDAVDRAAAVTRKLLALSRNQPVQRTAVDLNLVVRELLPLLRQLVTDRVEVEFREGAGLSHVKADVGQMEQVLLNLATNARDAMQDGGCLRIETANKVLSTPSALFPGLAAGRYTALVVSDEGVGMSNEVKKRIFEPFFSTKPRERGMGLGLAMVHGIVTDSEGAIAVETAPGRGSTFTILLPQCLAPAPQAAAPEAPPASASTLRTLLLVDDEASVRAITRRMLEQQGYRVIESENGHDALEVAARRDLSIDLLVTDLVMPGLHGSELIAAFRELRPHTPVVCITGFAGEIHDAPDLDGIVSSVVAKPFSSETLVRSVAAALSAAPAAPAGLS